MAFVIRSEKRPSHIKTNTNESLGPGKYTILDEKQINQSYVPFNSSETKEKLNTSLDPGPGYYEPEIINVTKNDEVKNPFIFNSKRFTQVQNINPGPGFYSPDIIAIKNKQIIQKESKNDIVGHLMKINKYQTIPSIPGRSHSLGYSENQNKELQLNEIVCQDQGESSGGNFTPVKKKRGTEWSKYLLKRTDQKLPQVPGAGYYEVKDIIKPLYQFKQSYGFASRTQRAQETRKGMIFNQFLKEREEIDSDYEYIEESTPGPGYYEISPQHQSKPDKYQFFGCSSDRFKTEMTNSHLGPGCYNYKQKYQIQGKNPPFLSSNTRFENIDNKLPPPGLYENKQAIEYKIKSINKKDHFISQEKRFKNIDDDLPGPGSYLEVIPEKSQDENPTANFKSLEKRFKKPKNDQKPAIGVYEVDYYDISKKVIKEEDDEDFKIDRPGFLSYNPRFEWERQERRKKLEKELGDEDEEDLSSPTLNGKLQDFYKEDNKSKAPFNTRQRRFPTLNNSKVPGPGYYKEYDNWNKRTYNVIFAEY